ncbi:MAG: hypothetical protein ABIA04_02435 [Pseudomonadota bacterium]
MKIIFNSIGRELKRKKPTIKKAISVFIVLCFVQLDLLPIISAISIVSAQEIEKEELELVFLEDGKEIEPDYYEAPYIGDDDCYFEPDASDNASANQNNESWQQEECDTDFEPGSQLTGSDIKVEYQTYFAFAGAYAEILKAIRMLKERVDDTNPAKEIFSIEGDIIPKLQTTKVLNRSMPRFSWNLINEAISILETNLVDKECVAEYMLQGALMALIPAINKYSEYEKDVIENYAKSLLAPGVEPNKVNIIYPDIQAIRYDKYSWTVYNVWASCNISSDANRRYFPKDRKCEIAQIYNSVSPDIRKDLILITQEALDSYKSEGKFKDSHKDSIADTLNNNSAYTQNIDYNFSMQEEFKLRPVKDKEVENLLYEAAYVLAALDSFTSSNKQPPYNHWLNQSLLLTLLANPDAAQYDPRLKDFADLIRVEIEVAEGDLGEIENNEENFSTINELLNGSQNTAATINKRPGSIEFIAKKDKTNYKKWKLYISSKITGPNLITLNHYIMVMSLLKNFPNIDAYFKNFEFYSDLLITEDMVTQIKELLPSLGRQFRGLQRLLYSDEAIVSFKETMRLSSSEEKLFHAIASPETMADNLSFISKELEKLGYLEEAEDLKHLSETLDSAADASTQSRTRGLVTSGARERIVDLRFKLFRDFLGRIEMETSNLRPSELSLVKTILRKKTISPSELDRLRRYFSISRLDQSGRVSFNLAHGIRRGENLSPERLDEIKKELEVIRDSLKTKHETIVSTHLPESEVDEIVEGFRAIARREGSLDPELLELLELDTAQYISRSDELLYELKKMSDDIDALIASVNDFRKEIKGLEKANRGKDIAEQISIRAEPLFMALSRIEDTSSSMKTIEERKLLGDVGRLIGKIITNQEFERFVYLKNIKVDLLIKSIGRLAVSAAKLAATGIVGPRTVKMAVFAREALRLTTAATLKPTIKVARWALNSKFVRFLNSTPVILAILGLEVAASVTIYSMSAGGLHENDRMELKEELVNAISTSIVFAMGGLAINSLIALKSTAAGGAVAAGTSAVMVANSYILLGAAVLFGSLLGVEMGHIFLPKYIPGAIDVVDFVGDVESDIALGIWSIFAPGKAKMSKRIIADDGLVDFGVGMEEGDEELIYLDAVTDIYKANDQENLFYAELKYKEAIRAFSTARLSYLYWAISRETFEYFDGNMATKKDVERLVREYYNLNQYIFNNGKDELFGLADFNQLKQLWLLNGIPARLEPMLKPIKYTIDEKYIELCSTDLPYH